MSTTDAGFIEGGKGKQSFSRIDSTEILRNIADMVGSDGERAPALLELLSMIQMDTRMGGLIPLKPVCIRQTAAIITNKQIVYCPAGSRIVIFDIFVSLNAATTIQWNCQDGVQLMSDMIAPLPGQGFTRTSPKGLFLPAGKSLCYSCTAAVAHSLDVSYALISTEQ